MTGVRSEKIAAHVWPVRGHYDEIGIDGFGFLDNLMIDAALAYSC
jgi:hypothetical protein